MRVNSPLYLDARFRSRFIKLAEDKRIIELHFRIFESYRSDDEQRAAVARGVSKAKPGESAHQWGLAADFVPYLPDTGWDWPEADCECWKVLHAVALQYDLEAPIEWDKPHISVPQWKQVKRADARAEAERLYQRRVRQ